MELNTASSCFAALSQETRLKVFRLLLVSGSGGLAAGEISRRLGVAANTLSNNLSVLSHAGLVRKQREGRSIRYFADLEGIRALLNYLMQDCCGGHPERCQPFIDALPLSGKPNQTPKKGS